jgi:hypothetical protein
LPTGMTIQESAGNGVARIEDGKDKRGGGMETAPSPRDSKDVGVLVLQHGVPDQRSGHVHPRNHGRKKSTAKGNTTRKRE